MEVRKGKDKKRKGQNHIAHNKNETEGILHQYLKKRGP